MSSLRQMDLPIDASRNRQKMDDISPKKRKLVATTAARGYPDPDFNASGFRNAAPLIGGRKVKRAGAPPAVKRALKSMGKQTVKAAAAIGQDALDTLTATSSQMAQQAPDKLTQMAMSGGKTRKPSAWINHVKAYASKHGVSYKQAMSEAKATYKR
jgi:hypothetical protein